MEAKRQQKKNREAQSSKYTPDSSDSMDISNPKNDGDDDDLKKIHLENSRRLAELRKVFKLVLDRWRSRPVK